MLITSNDPPEYVGRQRDVLVDFYYPSFRTDSSEAFDEDDIPFISFTDEGRIKKDIEAFSKRFEEELAVLSRYYDKVEVKWGILQEYI